MSKFNGVKTDNAPITAKRQIRLSILDKIKSPRVCEVFCGAGEMYRSVWHKADDYIGIDRRKFFDERKTICGDAEKAIRIINLNEYNIFDIDAYGSPYNILSYIVQNRTEKGSVAFIITDGSAMDLRLGRVGKGLRELSGIKNHILKRASNVHDELIIEAIKNIERITGKAHSDFIIAKGKTGAAMRYYAFILNDAA